MSITLQISDSILPKIPQFWPSAHSAFAELIQNSFRSGATEIDIYTTPDTGLLIVRDNGRGIQNLAGLTTIGHSDWNGDVVEPAGMGFYAHFRYAQRTIVFSRGKRYRFRPDCLQGAPVDVRDCTESPRTLVRVEGIDRDVLDSLDFERMRPLPDPDHDISYRVNGRPVPNALAELTPLETSVGRLYLTYQASNIRYPLGIWEGLPVGRIISGTWTRPRACVLSCPDERNSSRTRPTRPPRRPCKKR